MRSSNVKQLVKHILPVAINDKLSKAVWRQLNPSWRLPSGLVVQVGSIAEWTIYNDIFVDGEYDAPIEMMLKDGEASPYILDIGANVGYFSLRFADKWLRERGSDDKFTLVGFECTRSTYTELQRRMSQPALAGSCRYYYGLVGKRAGTGYISTTPFHVTDAIISKPSFFSSAVPFIDLESLIPAEQPISLLKCDIDGAEELFLEHYPDLLKRVRVAVFELHAGKCNVARCLQLLKAAGLSHAANVRKNGAISVDVFRNAREYANR